jgi:hypothetical protein
MLLTTTTVTVTRPTAGDPYETSAGSTTPATGIAAHIGSASGSEIDRGGQLEQVDAVLLADPALDVRHTDLVTDDVTGEQYRVAWVDERQGLGLSHVKAGLTRYAGAAADG